MKTQMTFQCYEIKYLLDRRDKEWILRAMEPFMELDRYGRTTIRNIYYDTENFRLIRRSLEKPLYKEKLRVRSYQPARSEDPVFVELKKKYRSVVYKRRLVITEEEAMESFRSGTPLPVHSQIAEEVEYFRRYYGDLRPAIFLSYEREAYYAKDGSDFRVTFDENILYRDHDFSLGSGIGGKPLLRDGCSLMEIKTSGAIPLWMSGVLTERGLFRTSFSKYGAAYLDMTTGEKGGVQYA